MSGVQSTGMGAQLLLSLKGAKAVEPERSPLSQCICRSDPTALAPLSVGRGGEGHSTYGVGGVLPRWSDLLSGSTYYPNIICLDSLALVGGGAERLPGILGLTLTNRARANY